MGIKDDYDVWLGRMCRPGGVPAEHIDAAEAELGVVFPGPYRQFLAEHGAAVGGGVEIAGLLGSDANSEPPMWTDVVHATKRARRASAGALPDALVLVSDNGADVKYYLDTRLEGEGPVVAFGPGIDGEIVSHSFIDFVVRLAKSDLR